MRHHFSALAQMYDEPLDFVALAIFLVILLVIVLIVVLFVRGVSREVGARMDARKTKIDSRPGFPVDFPPGNRP